LFKRIEDCNATKPRAGYQDRVCCWRASGYNLTGQGVDALLKVHELPVEVSRLDAVPLLVRRVDQVT
jgi:hypothetical protein